MLQFNGVTTSTDAASATPFDGYARTWTWLECRMFPKAEDTLSSRHVSSRDVTSAVGIFNIKFWRRLTLLSTLLMSHDLMWSSGRLTCQHASQISVVAHISWDVTYVLSALQHCYQLFPEIEEMLIGNVCQRSFLYDTKSPDYRDQHMRANAWEDIGKELKIKRKTWCEDSVSPA
jgi:hypothetical protein